jgi:hypothetical protein
MRVSIEVVDSRWLEGGAAPGAAAPGGPAVARCAGLGPGAVCPTRLVAAVVRGHDRRAGAVVHTGTHALGDPAWLLPLWLKHATRDGDVVPAGTIVTTAHGVAYCGAGG